VFELQLSEVSRRHDVTVDAVALSVWGLLLSRWHMEEELAIQAVIANVPSIATLQLQPRDHDTAEQFLRRTDALLAELIVSQPTPLQRERGSCAVVQYKDQAHELSLSLSGSRFELVAELEYSPELFQQAEIERMAAALEMLLSAIHADGEQTLDQLSLLSASDRDRVLIEFNATVRAYPKDVLIHELFEEQARRTPDVVAVSYEGERLTYAQLNARANQLAMHLRQQGVGADEVVAICVNRGLPMVVGLLGILKAGGAYLPLDPNYPPERLEYMLQDAAPRVVLTERSLLSLLPADVANVIVLEEQQATLSAYADSNVPVAQLGLRPHHLLYVIYTSGSTGRPKGTAMSHGAMVNLIEWHRETLGLEPGERVLQFAALSFDVAFQEIFSTLCTGGSLVMLNEWVRRDARALRGVLSEQGIQRLFVPPLMLQSLAEQAKEQGTSDLRLRDVITAGEQLRISAEIVSLFERHAQAHPGCRLHNHYGPTESHVVTALTLEGEPQQWPTLPAIGRPIANTQMYVLDRHRQPVPIGVAGEVFIGGANVAREYLRRAELTAQRFVADPFDATGRGRLYKTGDLGRWRADGVLEYLGRNDDQVKIRGFRIELGEIEARLATHESVKEAAVIAREDAATGKRLVAYVTPREGQQPTAELLRDHVKQALPDHMVPTAFVVLEKMPVTPSGKLERRSLPAPDPASYVSRQYEAPQGEVEQALAAIWQELLQVAQVGRHDNFFELGGHSLLATRVMARVQKTFQVDIPLRALFDMPTVHRLADRIGTLHAGQDDITHQLRQELHDLDDDAVQARIAELERELNLSA
jgi:amino acid adenylation domain-containing protein